MLRRNEVEKGFEGVWIGEARARPRVRKTVVGRTRGVRVAYRGARATTGGGEFELAPRAETGAGGVTR
jgi:hypothetical protein